MVMTVIQESNNGNDRYTYRRVTMVLTGIQESNNGNDRYTGE